MLERNMLFLSRFLTHDSSPRPYLRSWSNDSSYTHVLEGAFCFNYAKGGMIGQDDSDVIWYSEIGTWRNNYIPLSERPIWILNAEGEWVPFLNN